jgi:hypothetical protein
VEVAAEISGTDDCGGADDVERGCAADECGKFCSGSVEECEVEGGVKTFILNFECSA